MHTCELNDSQELLNAKEARKHFTIPLQVLLAAAKSGEYHMKLLPTRAFCERLVPAPLPAPRPSPAACHTAIVLGGSKGLGFELAKHLLSQGASTVVLASRAPDVSQTQLEQLSGNGQAVFPVTCDASKPGVVTRLLDWARETLPPIQVACLLYSIFQIRL